MSHRDRPRFRTVRVGLSLPLSAEQAWELVADARNHGRWVPLTRVDLARRAAAAPSAADPATGPATAGPSGRPTRIPGHPAPDSHHPAPDPATPHPASPPGARRRRSRPRPGWSWCPPQVPPRAGDIVVAVSGLGARRGAPGLVDRMRIERYDPPHGSTPGTAEFVKLGPVLGGAARITVAGDGPGRSRVTWSERVHLLGAPPVLTGWAGALGLRAMLGLVSRRIERDAMNRRPIRT
ncbi:hypothetical protein [Cellulomonas denverensis]|uniref:hypothetical protein n=1 Tax=Cellulomonas denverensis TaxID=264297 RepID=UPI0035EC5525